MAKNTTDATFEADVLLSERTVLVDFWASWCGPCRAVAPILDQIGSEHADKIDIVKLNVDENPLMAQRYGITSIPAMKVFRAGNVEKSVVGAMPKRFLEEALAEFIS